MTDHKYKVGDEVWVRGRVDEVNPENGVVLRVYMPDGAPLGKEPAWEETLHPVSVDVRPAADFKDPLGEAIVEAAIAYSNNYLKTVPTQGYAEELYLAVQAKLDANKPKTAEEIVLSGIDEYDRLRPGATWRRAIEAEHVVSALREAGLLKDSES